MTCFVRSLRASGMPGAILAVVVAAIATGLADRADAQAPSTTTGSGFASSRSPQPAVPPAPGGAAVLTFEQALAHALERSPAILAASSGRELAMAQLRRARAWENPTLEIEAENVLGQGAYADFGSAETTVSLSQPLPLGGSRAAGVRGARAGEAWAAAEVEVARRHVRRDVAIAYADAIAAERIAAIERERARIGAETRAAVEKRFAAGLESALQRARVEVETSGLQAAARRATAESLSRRRALGALWRADAVTEPLDNDWFDAMEAAGAPAERDSTRRVDAGAGGAAAVAQEHPRLRSADLAVGRARAALEAARAQRFHGLEARVGTRRFADQPGGSDQAFVIGVAMPLPLWDRNEAGIAEARAALSAAEVEAERVRRDLDGERADAAADYEAAAMEAGALATRGLPAAQSAARLAQQGYEAGRLSLFDRLEAERALSDVRERLEGARRVLRRAGAVLESLQ